MRTIFFLYRTTNSAPNTPSTRADQPVNSPSFWEKSANTISFSTTAIGMMLCPLPTPSPTSRNSAFKRPTFSKAFFYCSTPWFVNEQHAGFIQLYSGVSFVLVKGASHQVPQSKRAEAFELFHSVISSQGSQESFKEKILKL